MCPDLVAQVLERPTSSPEALCWLWRARQASTLGPILGAGVLSAVEEVLKRTFAEGYLIGYGVVLVASILFMPRGLVGLATRLRRSRRPPTGATPPSPEEPL